MEDNELREGYLDKLDHISIKDKDVLDVMGCIRVANSSGLDKI